MTDIPKAVWSGTFKIYGVELKCHVLDNGQRIIDADSIEQLFAEGNHRISPDGGDELEAFSRWQKGLPHDSHD
jgi:hypothetical protein